MQNKVKWFILPVSVLLLNAVLKSLYLGAETIDIDEPFSIHFAVRSMSDLGYMVSYEIIPPLFYTMLHFWVKLFGLSPASVRFLPMLFGSLTGVIVYLIGTRFYNLRVGISAALLFTFSNMVTMESHDTRVYTMFMFLCAASIYVYLQLISSPKKIKLTVWLTFINIIILFTNPFGTLIIGLQLFYTIVHPVLRKTIVRHHLISIGVLALLYLPYFFTYTLELLLARNEAGDYPESALSNLHLSAWAFSNYDYLFLIFSFLLILLLPLILVIKKRKPSLVDFILYGWFFIPYVLLFLVSFKFPVTNPKYFLFIAPGFYLIIAVGANSLYPRNVTWKALRSNMFVWAYLALTGTSIIRMMSTSDIKISNYAGLKDVVEIVQHKKSDTTAVYLTPPWLCLSYTYYTDHELFKDPNVRDLLEDKNVYAIFDKNQIPENSITHSSDAIFVIGKYNAPNFESTREINSMLKERFTHEKVLFDTLGYKVSHFY